MGKTLNRDQRKVSKYSTREADRKFKEQQQFIAYSGDEAPKAKVKPKWKPRSEDED